ncbi:MAG: helix-turn-helix domain-containing protein [Lachnospiraceae bacterium]|nr:helix-turn-helix domain-containing protein [Lachnospiraceae bacterium]
MANITARTSANAFYKSRCNAATHNEQLSSREGAADIMSIDRGRLYRIESGIANPYPEEVHLMADLYNAPELRNYFCKNVCPLGEDIPKAEVADLDRITVRTLSAIRKLSETKELLLDITEDGVIDESEKGDMKRVLQNLEGLEQITQNLKLWIKKNL